MKNTKIVAASIITCLLGFGMAADAEAQAAVGCAQQLIQGSIVYTLFKDSGSSAILNPKCPDGSTSKEEQYAWNGDHCYYCPPETIGPVSFQKACEGPNECRSSITSGGDCLSFCKPWLNSNAGNGWPGRVDNPDCPIISGHPPVAIQVGNLDCAYSAVQSSNGGSGNGSSGPGGGIGGLPSGGGLGTAGGGAPPPMPPIGPR